MRYVVRRIFVFLVVIFISALLFYAKTGFCRTDISNVKVNLTAEEKAFLADHAPIHIGIMNNWPPLNYVDESGKPAGIGVSYFKALNKNLGGVLIIVPAPFKENYEKVKNKKLEALMDITPKKDREPFFEFTEPYLTVPHVIVGRKDGPYFSSEKDLKGKTVALEKGYYNIIYFRENYPEVKIREYDSTSNALGAVVLGEADAYAGNRAVVIYLIEKELISNLQLQGRLNIPPSFLTIGVRKDWPILAVILNKALSAISESEREAINAHYIASLYEPWFSSKQFWMIILISIGIVVLIGLVSMIWNRSLKRLVDIRTEELSESEKKYRELIENSGQVILVVQDAQIKYVNKRVIDFVGLKPEEVLDKPFVNYIHPDDRKMVAEYYIKRIKGESAPNYYSFQVVDKAGGIKWVEINAVLIKWQGKPATLNFLTDITERKLMEAKELEIAKVREMDRLKSLFIASMSHELRTPLNSIIGFTGILLMGMAGELNEEQKKQLTMVKSSAGHLLSLISDVIDVSKIEAEKIQLSIEEFDLSSIVKEITDSFAVTLQEKAIKMSIDAPDKAVIKSDARRTKQIIMNLVSNAVKYTDKGEIKIKIVLSNERAEVSVTDTGLGIKEEDMPKLFKQFSRIITPDTPRVEGVGLGLYLSQKLAKLLGGKIAAKSEFRKGSEFTLTLPLEHKGA